MANRENGSKETKSNAAGSSELHHQEAENKQKIPETVLIEAARTVLLETEDLTAAAV